MRSSEVAWRWDMSMLREALYRQGARAPAYGGVGSGWSEEADSVGCERTFRPHDLGVERFRSELVRRPTDSDDGRQGGLFVNDDEDRGEDLKWEMV